MGILKVLFILIFISFPLGVLVRVSLVPQAFIYPVDLAIIIFITVALYAYLANKKSKKLFYPFIPFIIVGIVSLFVNFYWLSLIEFMVSSLYLIRFSMYLLLIPLIGSVFNKSDVLWLMRVVIISLLVTVAIGISQYFLYPDLRNLMYLGWDVHLYRVFSSFLDPNFASVIFIIGFWLVIYHARYSQKNKLLLYASVLATIFIFIAILLTYSRTGYLAFGFSAVIFFILEKKIKLISIIFLIFLAGIFFLPKDMQSEGVNLFRTASIYSRLESFSTSWKLYKENPVLGVGFNTYRYAQEREKIGQPDILQSHAGAGVSNSYLFVLVTTGIVGLITFVIGMFKLYREINIIRRSNSVLGNSIFALFTAVLAGSLVENLLFYSFILILLCVSVGIARLTKENT